MSKLWHKYSLRVHYKETDQMRVVHHANYVSWFEIARTECMRALGFAYSEVERRGLMLPVLTLNVKYDKPAQYDDFVAIYTQISSFTPLRLEFSYEVRRPANLNDETESAQNLFEQPEGELLVSGSSSHLWVNSDWKPARVDRRAPDIFALLNEYSRSE